MFLEFVLFSKKKQHILKTILLVEKTFVEVHLNIKSQKKLKKQNKIPQRELAMIIHISHI